VDRADPTVVEPAPMLRREGDAWSLTYRSTRPFHPERLHDALDQVMERALRSHGEVWIASRPEAVVGWESTGPRLNLGRCGTWTTGARSTLQITGVTDTPADLVIALDQGLLTDDELAAGPHRWTAWDDPFAAVWAAAHDEIEEAS
jgi:G3E family GTPase